MQFLPLQAVQPRRSGDNSSRRRFKGTAEKSEKETPFTPKRHKGGK